MTGSLRVGLVGGGGRMGQAVRAAIEREPDLSLGPAPGRGEDLSVLAGSCDVVVDFSTPETVAPLATVCGESDLPWVCGTTGLYAVAHKELVAAAMRVPVVFAPNMSIGVNILLYITEKTSEVLGSGWRVRVHETHHVHKKDAPSGTALALGERIAGVRGRDTVQYEVRREGEVVGLHRVVFEGPGERIALEHEALDRGIFALGALAAARWVVGRPPGLYGMDEVLGLK